MDYPHAQDLLNIDSITYTESLNIPRSVHALFLDSILPPGTLREKGSHLSQYNHHNYMVLSIRSLHI